jgi:hypothetical protein
MIQLYEVDSSKQLADLLASNPNLSFVFFLTKAAEVSHSITV